MQNIVGLVIVICSLLFAISAAVMAWRLKKRLDQAEVEVQMAKFRWEERRKIYQEVIGLLDQAIAEVSRSRDYEFDTLFNELSPKLQLQASEQVNSTFSEVCLSLEAWFALKQEVEHRQHQLLQNPDRHTELNIMLTRERRELSDAYQTFQQKFHDLGALMRQELS